MLFLDLPLFLAKGKDETTYLPSPKKMPHQWIFLNCFLLFRKVPFSSAGLSVCSHFATPWHWDAVLVWSDLCGPARSWPCLLPEVLFFTELFSHPCDGLLCFPSLSCECWPKLHPQPSLSSQIQTDLPQPQKRKLSKMLVWPCFLSV